jgi:hypothetical protein
MLIDLWQRTFSLLFLWTWAAQNIRIVTFLLFAKPPTRPVYSWSLSEINDIGDKLILELLGQFSFKQTETVL